MKWIIAILLCATMFGCATPGAANRQEPKATVTPTVTAGDFAEIKQSIKTILNTVSTITQNFALDKERAKLEATKLRKAEKREAIGTARWVGLALIFLAMPAPALGYWRGVIIVIGLAMMAGGDALTILIPW